MWASYQTCRLTRHLQSQKTERWRRYTGFRDHTSFGRKIGNLDPRHKNIEVTLGTGVEVQGEYRPYPRPVRTPRIFVLAAPLESVGMRR